MEFAKVLRNLLEERRMTLTGLARATGLKNSTLHGWLHGRSCNDLHALKKIAAVLKVPTHYLMFGEADPFSKNEEPTLQEIFSGDVRVTVHRILKSNSKK